MISVAEARRAISEALPRFASEDVPLAASCGRVLRQDVHAERDQPPFDRVMMDGVALRHAEFVAGTRSFRIAATQHAGDPQQDLPTGAHCIETMTGAVLPRGADCVIPVERYSVRGGAVAIEDGYTAESRQFIHPRASDHVAGTRLLQTGRRLTAIDVALLASAGCASVTVARQPAIRVISTGNELVPAGDPIEPHQIRLSNGPALAAMLAACGFADTGQRHLPDDPVTLQEAIGAELNASDVLVLSGGVSMGKADFVPRVLSGLGVREVFHRVSQRPGKPLWFGTGPDQQLVFALPGNPVSALTCCRHYVVPALVAASGAQPPASFHALLSENYHFAPKLTCFLPVRLAASTDGCLHAVPMPTNTSGDFAALAETDGYLELTADTSDFAAGTAQPFYPWQHL